VGGDPADTRAAVRPTLVHTEINERLHEVIRRLDRPEVTTRPPLLS
jgi:hypothetical protein